MCVYSSKETSFKRSCILFRFWTQLWTVSDKKGTKVSDSVHYYKNGLPLQGGMLLEVTSNCSRSLCWFKIHEWFFLQPQAQFSSPSFISGSNFPHLRCAPSIGWQCMWYICSFVSVVNRKMLVNVLFQRFLFRKLYSKHYDNNSLW